MSLRGSYPSNRIGTRIGIPVALLLLAGRGVFANTPPAVAALTFDQLLTGGVTSASAVFLSENTLALLIRSSGHARNSMIFVLRLVNGEIRVVASTEKPFDGDRLFAVSGSQLLVAGVHVKSVYSQDLHQKWELPMKVLCKQFPGANIIGEGGHRGEKVFKLATPPTPIRHSDGELLAVSKDMLAYQTTDTIRVITAQGVNLGAIRVPPLNASDSQSHFNNLEFAGPDRLYFSTFGKEYISDLEGKQIAQVHPPSGWGFRYGWSASGSRLLFDRYQDRKSFAEHVLGAVSEAVGVPLPEQANAEVIRVVDILSGAICFNLESPDHLLGPVGEYHADLSPSGELVAVANLTSLRVYRLPNTCSGK